MKTTKISNRSLPSHIRFSIYLAGLAVFWFINWSALKAIYIIEEYLGDCEFDVSSMTEQHGHEQDAALPETENPDQPESQRIHPYNPSEKVRPAY